MERIYSATEWCARIAEGRGDEIQKNHSAARLFIGGDRSQVGKSSLCLAVVASLVERLGFKPEEVAYIKPATQCEATQLVTKFCKNRGIDCVPIGPVVYVSGFTRAFLQGETKSSLEMIQDVEDAINTLASAPRRKIVIVDGVGFPAVGSIVGMSNAVLAQAARAPVVLVCPKGVGNAVDSFNLNRVYFEHHGVDVLGAVFNRFPTEGFYSREKCKDSIDLYMNQFQRDKAVYGYLPEIPQLDKASPAPAEKPSSCTDIDPEAWTEQDEERLQALLNTVAEFGDINRLVQDALRYHQRGGAVKRTRDEESSQSAALSSSNKRARSALSLDEIRNRAKANGASSGG